MLLNKFLYCSGELVGTVTGLRIHQSSVSSKNISRFRRNREFFFCAYTLSVSSWFDQLKFYDQGENGTSELFGSIKESIDTIKNGSLILLEVK
jgi:hypothetical protein